MESKQWRGMEQDEEWTGAQKYSMCKPSPFKLVFGGQTVLCGNCPESERKRDKLGNFKCKKLNDHTETYIQGRLMNS